MPQMCLESLSCQYSYSTWHCPKPHDSVKTLQISLNPGYKCNLSAQNVETIDRRISRYSTHEFSYTLFLLLASFNRNHPFEELLDRVLWLIHIHIYSISKSISLAISVSVSISISTSSISISISISKSISNQYLYLLWCLLLLGHERLVGAHLRLLLHLARAAGRVVTFLARGSKNQHKDATKHESWYPPFTGLQNRNVRSSCLCGLLGPS